MKARWLRRRFSSRTAAALTLAWLLLAAWAVALAAAALQLDAWRRDLSRTLLQLDADAQFRARAHSREAVDPEWYRRKALALLAATQRLQDDQVWTVLLPGSWHRFDKLEEQVQQRLAREFADIVVETMRRELHARASRITGVPLVRGSGELQPGADCQSPVPQHADRKLSAAAEDLPEFVAVADYVREVERLDRALQSLRSLQLRSGGPDELRELVAYTLGQKLPGALEGAVRMFPTSEEVDVQPALMQSKLQGATRCSLGKAMSALLTRLLNTNDLFALEQGLVERSQGLFDASVRPASFDRTLERYRAVHGLLDDQQALLAQGHNDWMRQGTLQLGPAYQDLLHRIERTRLLGPEVVQQLGNQSGQAFAEFRREFEQAFDNGGEPGIVWLEHEQRFGLSADRAALREGLGALLKTSFMDDEAGRAGEHAHAPTALAKVLQEARALAQERERAVADIVPQFPPYARPVVRRVVDARVSELIYQRAFLSLKAALPADSSTPLDRVAFGEQREQVLALRDLLKETGAPTFGERLVATLDGELLRRLALLQEDWQQQPLESARLDDFGWWQGDSLSLAQALGATDPTGTAPSFARSAARLDELVQRARGLLALGSPALAHDPAAQRWTQLQDELERYQAHRSDSSFVQLERYVAALGPDLRRDNCVERLTANPTGVGNPDAIAQRQVQMHEALTRRCTQLHEEPVIPAAPMALPAATSAAASLAQ
jgi:type VI secretion system protein ImpL